MISQIKGRKVFVGMSGGVDSSVAAALLVEQGYDVTGVYMKNWSGDDYGIQADCPWEQDQADAEAVCKQLGIPFRSFNFEREYRAQVVEYFFSEYQKGRTPNPDVMCNRQIKFGLFLDKALKEGADFIATGHYARVKQDNNGYQLLKGLDQNKDQSYFLYNVTQEQLGHTLFPVGELTKPEVRKKAGELGLKTAAKPDSQGICFIGEINVLNFLKSRLPEKEGAIVDIDSNETVGSHKGSYFYTLGQREGLHIGGQKDPYFVVKTDVEKNIVYVGHGHNHSRLMSKQVKLESLHLINQTYNLELITQNSLSASIRYRHKPKPGKLSQDESSTWIFTFDEPQRAITPGQSLVIYQEDMCLGGGVISSQ